MSTSITLGICTFRREHIATTLASVALLELPYDHTLRTVVADNDDEPTAQVTVAAAAEKYGLIVNYIHAPARNISIARNACLDAADSDFFAFIDDDEIVTPGWLVAMLTAQRATHADMVLGPVQALYAEDAPNWLRYGNFHSTRPKDPSKLTTGYAGNILLNPSSPALVNLRFREELGTTGGEDTDFFARAIKAGARLTYTADALVYEGVPPERANLRWLLARRLTYGATHARWLIEAGKPRTPSLIIATLKMLFCYAMAVICILFPILRREWLLRGTLHLGVVRTLRSIGNK